MAFYAIAIKNFVELREAAQAPRAEISEFKRKVKLVYQDWSRPTSVPAYTREEEREINLKHIIHEGGNVIGSIPMSVFIDVLERKQALRDGKCVRLPKASAEKLIAKMVRVQNEVGAGTSRRPRG